jgi:hypothetical protein
MKIGEVQINGRAMTKTGRIGRVTAACDDGRVYVLFGSSDYPENMQASDLGPVSDPCTDCQKLADSFQAGKNLGFAEAELVHELEKSAAPKTIELQSKKITELQKERDNWEATAQQHCRNAAHWREELEKLQKEALAECDENHIHPAIHIEDFRKRPLSEVAKCYIRVAPEKLLMSDGARIICELLEGSGPMTSSQIADRLHLLERCILESITESRDVGKIRLVGGKYEIMRD